MDWTARLLQAEDRDSYWKISVEFTNGLRTIAQSYRFTGATVNELNAFVRSETLKFNKTDPVDLAPFVGRSIDVTPPSVVPPDPPTQADIDRRKWFVDWRKLNQWLELTTAVPALETAQTTALIANLRTSLESNWNNSYLGDL